MLSNKALVVLFGLVLAFNGVRTEDAADGEVSDDGTAGAGGESIIEDDLSGQGPAKDAGVSFHFTYPADANTNRELLAGKNAKFLIGFQNRGEKDFTVKYAETSFRYHQDFNYHLQNFTMAQFNRKVQPKEEVTLEYGFPVYEQFAGRPLGLVVRVHYEDSENQYFISTAFNETINVADDDVNYRSETYFMYFVFSLLGIGALMIGRDYLGKLTRKHGMSKKAPVVEQGTSNSNEVDYEWIPREVLRTDKKSPKPASPKPKKAQKAE